MGVAATGVRDAAAETLTAAVEADTGVVGLAVVVIAVVLRAVLAAVAALPLLPL